MWNEIVANIKDFFSQPIPVIGVSIGFLLIFVLVIFSKTSIGKKALNFLKEKVIGIENGFNSFKNDMMQEREKLVNFYQEEQTKADAKIAVLEELLLEVAENTHNAKIKEKVEEAKSKLSITKTRYEELIESKVNEAKKQVSSIADTLKEKANDEIQKVREKYESELKAYKDKFDNLLIELENNAQNAQKQANSLIEEAKQQLEDKKNEVLEQVEEKIETANNVKDGVLEVIENERKENTTRTEEEINKD